MGRRFREVTWEDAVQYLSNESRSRILVFEGADDHNIPLTKYFPRSPAGRIVITTRNREAIEYTPNGAVEIAGLGENEAVSLLHKSSHLYPASNDDSLCIVQELGCLALAVTRPALG